jgi:hypothetical protein
MRRLLAALTLTAACLLGLPATTQAVPAPEPLGGGDLLYDPTGAMTQCLASFAAVSGSDWYLVAGRGCGSSPGTDLYGDITGNAMVLVGTVVSAQPGYTIVHVTNTTDWELVGWIESRSGRLPVSGSAETPIGGPVCLVDHNLGTRCGTVLARNETISVPPGVITGLTRTNICASPRAVAYVSGGDAQGVPIGGSGICTTPGRSWFTPINTILARHRLALLKG